MNKNTFPQTITGLVMSGQNKGGQTGARTANLNPILAKHFTKGLYACDIKWQNHQYKGLLFFGQNSLSKKDCLEVHILNFSQDLYGQEIEVTIKKFLRPEIRFKNIEDLKKQIKTDIKLASK
jgi:riboflavin kinase/FMN adenylyltransferase